MPVTLQHQTLKQKTMKFKSIILSSLLLTSLAAFAQEENTVETLNQRVTLLEDGQKVSSKLKISGYIQAQFESVEKDASTKVGDKVGTVDALEKSEDAYNRFGVRRGRIKTSYEDKDLGLTGVVQFDLTEKGVALKDAYMQILDPWTSWVSFKGGVFDRPFGYEISYSSSRRESPERSRVFQTLFPDERDLGAMLILQGPKTSPWNALKLEAGLFAGNGIYTDTDSKKDFMGHLTYNKSLENVTFGLGASMYKGFVAQTNAKVYEMLNGAFAEASSKSERFADRNYFGVDAQTSIHSVLGLTSLRGEYLGGDQPGRSDKSDSPKNKNIPGLDDKNAAVTGGTDTYLRKFNGGYVQLVQDIAETKHSITAKFDWYDPNTKVSKDEIGVAGATGTLKTNKADVAYTALGLGYLYRMNANVRIMAYYEMVKNEKSANLSGYTADKKDNVFTLRFQYKF